jgi:uncharacterized protein (TIGR02145 family)
MNRCLAGVRYRIIIRCPYLFLILFVFINCSSRDEIFLPIVETGKVFNITTSSAEINSSLISNGGSQVLEKGVCWSEFDKPSIQDNRIINSSDSSSYATLIVDLQPDRIYLASSYAINEIGVSYGEIVTFRTIELTVVDVDSNIYQTTEIGKQIWITENLKTTKYNDGTIINFVSEDAQWRNLSSGAYCWYNNKEEEYKDTYGPLYNWYAVNTKKLCPTGWHVPSDEDWSVLTDYLGGESVAGGKLKEEGTTHWRTPNTGATDEVRFSAVPGGLRMAYGYFEWDDDQNYLWSSTEHSNIYAWGRMLQFDSTNVIRWYYNRRAGLSVRCIKD